MQAWDTFLKDLEKQIGKQVVDKWLRPLKVGDFDACNLYLEAENSFQIEWFEEHIRKIAKTKLRNNNAHPIHIHFSKQKNASKKRQEEPLTAILEIESDNVDTSYTFTNYIFDQQTNVVIELLQNIEPGTYNPIFLYGPSGVGKTHLLMACAQKLKEQNLSVFFVHAETFTQHVIKAIRSSQMRKFRQIYRNQDVLIIDDIHCLARKAATQEELFHTFNALHTTGRQIIISSHLPPSQMEDIEPRLTSRFEWGILLPLHPLPTAEMGKVLKNRARMHHFPFPDPVCAFILETFATSEKSMMRALEALMMRYRHPSTITLLEAEQLLSDLVISEEKSQLTPNKILKAVSDYFGIRSSDILGKSQLKEYSLPRKLAMYLCRKKLKTPYLAIGRYFFRDHSTVMTNIKQIENKKETSEIELALKEINALLLSEKK